ncbi:unnamed protein product [Adineta steineri]|uniref:Cytidyltransferase-like domain-containing protein n=1 Tax=Adineta steineri TaxID=433720 RepID=A0A819DRT4_9BILA|nr:unnamed protein product [Adineta steineri]CAF3837323.1 unnamed protein product [Adineta steineri]
MKRCAEYQAWDYPYNCVLLTTGSMNPIHRSHINNLELVKKYLEQSSPQWNVLAGYLSPTHDTYVRGKLDKATIPGRDRCDLCELAIEEHERQTKTLHWLSVSRAEAEYYGGFIDFGPTTKALRQYLNSILLVSQRSLKNPSIMENYTIVWLDTNASDPESSFRTKLGKAQIFTDVNDCIKFIKSHSNKSTYLIVSGSLAKLVVPEVYDCSNLLGIFLFCGSVSTYAEWAMDYCDKLMIFDHGDDLLVRLWRDLESNLREQATLHLRYAEEYKQRALQYKQRPCG